MKANDGGSAFPKPDQIAECANAISNDSGIPYSTCEGLAKWHLEQTAALRQQLERAEARVKAARERIEEQIERMQYWGEDTLIALDDMTGKFSNADKVHQRGRREAIYQLLAFEQLILSHLDGKKEDGNNL